MKISLSAIFDCIFAGFVCFIVCFVFLNYLIERKFAIIFSIILSIPTALLVFKKLNAKKSKQKLKKAQNAQKQECIASLNLNDRSANIELFSKALSNAGQNAKRQNNTLILHDKKVCLFFCFSFDNVSKTDVVRAYNSAPKDYTTYLFSDVFSPEVIDFIRRFNKKIIAVDGVATYKFLKQNNCIPTNRIDFSQEKQTFSSAITNLIKKKNAKRYLSLGVTFLILSWLVPIKTYYIVMGCLFLIFSLTCRLFGKIEKTD